MMALVLEPGGARVALPWACSIAMCVSLTPVAVKFFFSFPFAIVVCVAMKPACCTLFVLPVVVPVANGVCVTGIAGLVISAVVSISWPWGLILVFCVIWAIRANVHVVCLILGISGVWNVHEILLYLANDVGPVLFSVLEVHSSVSSPVCVAWLCALCWPAVGVGGGVGVDRQVGPCSLLLPYVYLGHRGCPRLAWLFWDLCSCLPLAQVEKRFALCFYFHLWVRPSWCGSLVQSWVGITWGLSLGWGTVFSCWLFWI